MAAVLIAFTPALVLFGVTSVDYAFAALGTATAWLLVCAGPRAAHWPAARWPRCGSFFSWLLPAIAAWAVLVVLRRDGAGAPAVIAAAERRRGHPGGQPGARGRAGL